MRAARTARKDVNFEAPFGGLGSFSCKRSFLLEECLLRATISVVNKHQPARREDHRDLAPVQIDLAAACTDSGKLSRKCEYPP